MCKVARKPIKSRADKNIKKASRTITAMPLTRVNDQKTAADEEEADC